ncbi:MAG: hypothetical protein ACREE6_13765 [Limisphaerales bacterium]
MAFGKWNFEFLTQMHPFWNNIYDEAKDRRYGTLFVISFLVVVGLPFLVWMLGGNHFLVYLPQWFVEGPVSSKKFQVICLALAAVLFVGAIGLFWRQWLKIGRKARQERAKYTRLSRDELFKARSKLESRTTPVKFRAVQRPAKSAGPRRPDTDLRY